MRLGRLGGGGLEEEEEEEVETARSRQSAPLLLSARGLPRAYERVDMFCFV